MERAIETTRSYVGAPTKELDARRVVTRLRNLLRLNSLLSAVTGVLALTAGGLVSSALGTDQVWVIRGLGAGLVVFAGSVFIDSGSRASALLSMSLIISLADLGWVAGTVVVLGLGWTSAAGMVVVGLSGVVVLGMAVAQFRARGRAAVAISAGTDDLSDLPPIEVVTLRRSVSQPAESLWPVMIDHELYARLALNLSAAAGLSPDGPGFQRSCTDTAGRSWSETCTLWEPGRRFDVDVDTSDYPYPLALMQGSWEVEPAGPYRSTVGMTFVFQPVRGIRGRIFVVLMHLGFPPILRRIVRGWARAAGEA